MSIFNRTCIGCRQTGLAADLVRLSLVDGRVVIAYTSQGRGAWLHPTSTCLDLAEQKRAFLRAFKTSKAEFGPESRAALLVG